MTISKLSQWSQTAGNNTDIGGITLAEGATTPSQVNNAIRETMAQLADFLAGAQGDVLPILAGGTGSSSAAGVRTNLGLGLLAVKSIVEETDITAGAVTAPKLSGGTLNAGVGYIATAYNAGTKSTGTYTPDPTNGNFQYAVNGGAHTLAPPANDCSMVVQYTNNGSAGTVTTSGFTKVSGAFTTTNGDDFHCFITRLNGFSHLNIVALQ